VQEIVIGMAHRGRLNVLVNTLGKAPKDLFEEFEGKHGDDLPAGDVKYHQGFSSDISTVGGPVHLSLAFNPSHLEIVNPVVEGSVKARMDRRGDHAGKQVLPILVHGDAAFAGQGVVMETLNLAQTRGYGTGGTVHIVINNQIGFTTSDPRDARSTMYCSDVVKMIEAPVLHVNADDPEATVLASQIAMDYRMEFGKDIVVDIICFRKLGHNEQDTPALTQPLMYKKIGKHPGTRKLYADKLAAQNVIPADGGDRCKPPTAAMDAGKHTVDPVISNFKNKYAVDWLPFLNKKWTDAADTAVPLTELKRLATASPPCRKASKSTRWSKKCWPTAPPWAGRNEPGLGHGRTPGLRIAGIVGLRCAPDRPGCRPRHLHPPSRRAARPEPRALGCRHLRAAAEHRRRPGAVHRDRLGAVGRGSAGLRIRLLDRRTEHPDHLGSPVRRLRQRRPGGDRPVHQLRRSEVGPCFGLVMMLPHGYEGQGPEHSSARPERFLQLCADNNMQVVQPTTASQIFHVLRRQMVRQFRKPLVIMTPKSLLRNKDAGSPLTELAKARSRP
jgi:2-oxoglutarate dehydrogenase E1 component